MVRGDIDDGQANRIMARLMLFAADDPRTEIALHIDSPGGSVAAGMAIHDTMAMVEPPVATWAVGTVAGMAQVLLTAGTRGRRYALPHARIHLTGITAGHGRTPPDLAVTGPVLAEWYREMMTLTANATGQSVEQVTADAERRRVFTAHAAVAYGLVDHVVTGGVNGGDGGR